jgi:4-carboxymuconolactone decarboxylase
MRDSNDYRAGLEILRTLVGAPTKGGAIPPEIFDVFVVEHLYGAVWSRPALPLPMRSIITIAALVASGRESELRLHIAGAKNLGISREQLHEIMLHLAYYCGWPAARAGMKAIEIAFHGSSAASEHRAGEPVPPTEKTE